MSVRLKNGRGKVIETSEKNVERLLLSGYRLADVEPVVIEPPKRKPGRPRKMTGE